MLNSDKFGKALGFAVFLTDLDPFRFNRFADRVLGADHTAAEGDELKQQLKTFIASGRKLADAFKTRFIPLKKDSLA